MIFGGASAGFFAFVTVSKIVAAVMPIPVIFHP
jgi:hypothetical protein